MKIRVYDSGVGGRSVFQLIEQYLNTNDLHHSIELSYFGDTANFPYGTKSEEELKRIVFANLHQFEKDGINCVAVACNTASAVIEKFWHEKSENMILRTIVRPTVDVINREPAKYPSIFVIASQYTANNHIYQKAINRVQPQIEITEQGEQTLINHIEAGLQKEIQEEVAAIVTKVPNDTTLLWGCTHFSFVHDVFYEEMKKQNKNFQIIDPAKELAKTVIKQIEELSDFAN